MTPPIWPYCSRPHLPTEACVYPGYLERETIASTAPCPCCQRLRRPTRPCIYPGYHGLGSLTQDPSSLDLGSVDALDEGETTLESPRSYSRVPGVAPAGADDDDGVTRAW
jgi:hypothetical protein